MPDALDRRRDGRADGWLSARQDSGLAVAEDKTKMKKGRLRETKF